MNIALILLPPPSILAAAMLALCGIASAADAPAPSAASASAPVSTRLLAPITSMIGEAECDTQDQCRVIGVGAKACGGPSGYLAWSSKKTDANALGVAVQAQVNAQLDENKVSGLLSNCMVTPMPLAVCRPRASDGRKVCQLGQGGANSAI